MINLPSLESANIKGKKVFVRCDFDVPLEPAINNQPLAISDDTRLISGISTIEYLLEQNCNVIAAGHLGRPTKQFSIFNFQFSNIEPEFSLLPVAKWFAEEFPGANVKQTHIGGFPAWKLKDNFYILENLRFYKEEESNDSAFVHKLAYLADVYVNEAFGASHRPHASIVGLPSLLPHFPGFHLSKEIKILNNVIENPRRPLTIIIGGAKIETKLPLITRMNEIADYVLVGGQIAQNPNIIPHQKAQFLVADLNSDKTDITQKSLKKFEKLIKESAMVAWNGPMGLINEKLKIKNEKLAEGELGYTSFKLAKVIIESLAYKVVGGGDTVAFLNKHDLLSRFDFVSVGGGAMLEFLAGQSLPGIVALQN